MIKTLTAHTNEIDDPKLAVEEILEQLDIKNSLLKNSVGIISCYPEFVDTGVVKALGQRLPFSLVGCTTLGNTVEGASGLMLLCLTVLTADDVFFATAVSDPLEETGLEAIRKTYDEARGLLPGPVKLAVPFAPLYPYTMSGERFVKELDEAMAGIPIFGTLASDHVQDHTLNSAIYNGGSYKNCLSLLLISGECEPKFFMASIPEKKALSQRAKVTKSDGDVLIELNGMPFLEYMKQLDLSDGETFSVRQTIPLMVDYCDGAQPLARAIYKLLPGGHALCGASMPLGAKVSVASFDYEDTLESAQNALDQVIASGSTNGMLGFTCLSRSLVLGADMTAELDLVQNQLSGKMLFHVCYSGGEICPVYDAEGQLKNRFHNFTFVACVF
ncbi:FIST C-terminal domain-containing protein [Eubacteriales bacterium OttesenSCG-928-K08]|nr:FIST C-terminal domain-containing protein [Eubacteriales bacterium OttesenSCG-928-K08]